MFKAGQPNPYDDIVNKTTDENLTSENWELILNLCDKVQEEGQDGARNVIAAVLKRLAHRNPNVQLYALSLAEALSKNCSIELHREIASRAFTQGLEKLITDRTTHEKVKRRALGLVAMWTAEFENDSTLGIMEDCYNNLKFKSFKFEAPQEAPPPAVDDEIRRKEEEELQRVLEMSMQDKGGRGQWAGYSVASSSGAAGGSGSSSRIAQAPATAGSSSSAATSTTIHKQSTSSSSTVSPYAKPTYPSGYVPARTPSPKVTPASKLVHTHTTMPPAAATPVNAAPTSTQPTVASMAAEGNSPVVTRVRALHNFEPTEPGELAFDKGDVIKVVDRGYKDWWRGQLKGRTGIFPVNYVEPMPEPTAAELTKEAEQEAAVFSQAANVDRLLTMLRSLDPNKDNLADNEEIQELYRSSMALRPKIVKLIDKYSQKRADLVSMNETFVRARSIFDQMMEESLARNSGVYDQQQPTFRLPQYQQRPDSRGRQEYAPTPGPQGFGWPAGGGYEQPGYPGYAGPTSPYPYPDPNVYAQAQAPGHAPGQVPNQMYAPGYGPGQQSQQPPQQPQQQANVPYTSAGPNPYPVQQQQGGGQPPQMEGAPGMSRQQTVLAQQPGQPQPQPQQQTIQPQAKGQPQVQPQPQGQTQPQQQAAAFTQAPAQSTQPQQQAGPQLRKGPPYEYDPNGTYADPNVQAWAKYYAQGGKELAGAVYFISIPGVTDGAAQGSPTPQLTQNVPQQLQQQQQHQQQPQSQVQVQPSQFQPGPGPGPGAENTSSPVRTSSVDEYLPFPGATESNPDGYGGESTLGERASLPNLHTQGSQLGGPVALPGLSGVNGFLGAGPASPHLGNAGPPSWVQAQPGPNTPLPQSPSQPLQTPVYASAPGGLGGTSTEYLTQSVAPLHLHHNHTVQGSQPPQSPAGGPYGPSPTLPLGGPSADPRAQLQRHFSVSSVGNGGQNAGAQQGVGAPA